MPRPPKKPFRPDRAPRGDRPDKPFGKPRFGKPEDEAPRSNYRPKGDGATPASGYGLMQREGGPAARTPRATAEGDQPKFDRKPRGDKPFEKRPYDPDRKPAFRARSEGGGERPKFDRKPSGDKPFVKRPYDPDRKPPYRARSEESGDRPKFDRKPSGDKPFVKSPYDPDRKPPYRARSEEGGGRPKFDREPSGDKPFVKRSFDPDRKPAYRPRSEEGGERPAFEKRPYNRDGKPPFQKKPFVKRGWTEEKPVPRRDRDFPESRHLANPENDLIHGHHAVSAALANDKRTHVHLWATENGLAKLVEDNVTLPAEIETVHPRLLDHMLASQDAVHQGIVLETLPLEQPQLNQIEKGGLVVILDQVTDPHNVGAILRTAAAFGVAAVISPARHAAAATGVMFKAASGAYELVPMVKVTNLAAAMEELKGYGYTLIGLDSEAETSIDDVEKTRPMALVLGAEGKGLRELTRESCDVVAKLDMTGAIKSLNVSNAAAVSLYALTRG